MAMIPNSTIEKIKESVSIVDFIGKYVELQKKGANWFGLCPFHEEDTPSFSVNENRQSFRCFSCGRYGDVFTFMMELKGYSYPQAIQEVGSAIGVSVNWSDNAEKSKYSEEQKELIDINNRITGAFSFLLNSDLGSKAKNYLETVRKLAPATIEKFKLGFDSPDWNIEEWFEIENIDSKKAVESGVMSINEKGEIKNRFYNRVIVPLENTSGDVVAFAGRTIEKDSQVKYINGSETDIFQKSDFIYNLKNARQQVNLSGRLILLEGYMDVISADAAGVEFGIATMGTALTTQQINLISNSTKTVQIAYDGDNAGQEATWRAINLFKKHSPKTEILITVFPDEKDPDEFIQENGVEQFRLFVNGSKITPNEFALTYLKQNRNFNQEKDLIDYLNDVAKFIANESDIQIDIIANKLFEDTKISKDVILGIVEKNKVNITQRNNKNTLMPNHNQNTQNTIDVSSVVVRRTNDQKVERERTLITSAIKHPEIRKYLLDINFRFETEDNQKIWMTLKGTQIQNEFISSITNPDIKLKVESLMNNEFYDDRNIESVKEHVFVIRNLIPIEDEIKKLNTELQQARQLQQNENMLMISQQISTLNRHLKELRNGKDN